MRRGLLLLGTASAAHRAATAEYQTSKCPPADQETAAADTANRFEDLAKNLNAEELTKEGLTPEQAIKIAKLLATQRTAKQGATPMDMDQGSRKRDNPDQWGPEHDEDLETFATTQPPGQSMGVTLPAFRAQHRRGA